MVNAQEVCGVVPKLRAADRIRLIPTAHAGIAVPDGHVSFTLRIMPQLVSPGVLVAHLLLAAQDRLPCPHQGRLPFRATLVYLAFTFLPIAGFGYNGVIIRLRLLPRFLLGQLAITDH